MKAVRLGVLLLTVASVLSGCAADERWEGSLSRCTNNDRNDDQVLLILDKPRPPSPTGMLGSADSNDRDTWTLTDIKDSQGLGDLLFKATFLLGNGNARVTEEWDVELKAAGFTQYEGDVTITISLTLPFIGTQTDTVRCDLELSRIH